MSHSSHGSRGHLPTKRLLPVTIFFLGTIAALLILNAALVQRTVSRGGRGDRDSVGGHLGVPSRVAALQLPGGRGPHRLAVVVPYRGRESQLRRMLTVTADCIRRGTQGTAFDIFIIEQSPRCVVQDLEVAGYRV